MLILSRSKLEDLLMERGGRPMRSIILTSWRSGSTFLGDVVNAHPASFYHYEPLLDFGIVQIRGPPLADEALRNLESLLRCDFGNLGKDATKVFECTSVNDNESSQIDTWTTVKRIPGCSITILIYGSSVRITRRSVGIHGSPRNSAGCSPFSR